MPDSPRIDLTFTQDSGSDPIRVGKVIPHQGKRYVVVDISVVGYKGWVLIDGETEFREAVVWVEPVGSDEPEVAIPNAALDAVEAAIDAIERTGDYERDVPLDAVYEVLARYRRNR